MSRASGRAETIHILSREGVPLDVIQALLRAGATLHRLAELECSSEAADRDRVKCPGDWKNGGGCLCRDYGSFESHAEHVAECGQCGRAWCDRCDPVSVSALCHYCHGRGRSTHPVYRDDAGRPIVPRCSHGTVPRIAVQAHNTQLRVSRLCTQHGLSAIFGGDPRGAVLVVKVPSGRTNDWGGRGVVIA